MGFVEVVTVSHDVLMTLYDVLIFVSLHSKKDFHALRTALNIHVNSKIDVDWLIK